MSRNTTGEITIERSKRYTNGGRKYTLLIDGSKIGTIKNGETSTYSVPAGSHILEAKIDWLRSKPFQIEISSGRTSNLFIDCNNFRALDVIILLLVSAFCAGLGSMVMGMLGAAIGGGVGGFIYAQLGSRPYIYWDQ